ncbi:unnamed protein product, partial [Prorocentrum cordatum]
DTASALAAMPAFSSQHPPTGTKRAAPASATKRPCSAGYTDDDFDIVGDSDIKADVDHTKDSLMAAIERTKSDMANSFSTTIGNLASTVSASRKSLGEQVERRMAAVEFKIAARDERFGAIDIKLAELQRLVVVIRSEEPPPQSLVDRSAFDRDPDCAILVARSRTLCTMDEFKKSIGPILGANDLSPSEVAFEGAPASTRIHVRVRSAVGYAACKVAQILGSQHLGDNQWARHSVTDTSGCSTDLFLDSDKSPCQIKREQLAKTIRCACADAYPSKRFFGNKHKGEISAGWKPIVAISPNPGDAPPSIERAESNLVGEGIDRQRIADCIANLVSGPEPARSSLPPHSSHAGGVITFLPKFMASAGLALPCIEDCALVQGRALNVRISFSDGTLAPHCKIHNSGLSSIQRDSIIEAIQQDFGLALQSTIKILGIVGRCLAQSCTGARVHGLPEIPRRARLSDRAAISCATAPIRPAKDRAAPSDMFKRPELAANIGNIVEQVNTREIPPSLRLALHKEIMLEAARITRDSLIQGEPSDPLAQLIVLRTISRVVRRHHIKLAQRVMRARVQGPKFLEIDSASNEFSFRGAEAFEQAADAASGRLFQSERDRASLRLQEAACELPLQASPAPQRVLFAIVPGVIQGRPASGMSSAISPRPFKCHFEAHVEAPGRAMPAQETGRGACDAACTKDYDMRYERRRATCETTGPDGPSACTVLAGVLHGPLTVLQCMSVGRAMAPGATTTRAVGVAVGAPAAWAGLRLAGGWLAAVVAVSTTYPARACQALAGAAASQQFPAGAADLPLSGGTGRGDIGEKLPLATGAAGPTVAAEPPVAGLALEPDCASALVFAWLVAGTEFYRFSEPVRTTQPHSLVLRARTAQTERGAVEGSGQYYTWEGVSELRRRLPLRVASGGGDKTATPPGADAGPLMEAAAADAGGALRALDPPEGRTWVVASPWALPVGREEALAESSVGLDAHHAASRDGESRRVAEAIPVEEVDGHRRRRPRVAMNLLEGLSGGRRVALEGGPESAVVPTAVGAPDLEAADRDLRDRLGFPASEGAPDAEVADDARSSWAQHEERGGRHKPWLEVVREVKQHIFRDCGGNSLSWPEMWARDRPISSSDRTCIEMKCMLSATNDAGSCVQINSASMVSIEAACHGVSQIVEAYSSDPTKPPKRGGLQHYMGVTGPLGVVDLASRSAVFHRSKEGSELEDWKSRAAGALAPSPLALVAGVIETAADMGQLGAVASSPRPRRARRDFDEVVDAFNWLAIRTTTDAKPNFGQARVHARILECAGDSLPPLELYVRMIKLLYSKGVLVFSNEAERRGEIGEVGLVSTAIGDLAAAPDRRLVTACAALPMGFTWSLYFCQEVGDAAMGTTPEMERVHRMSDRGPATALRPSAPLAAGGGAQRTYVDNLGALGFNSGDVASSPAAAAARFDAAGLKTHETARPFHDVAVPLYGAVALVYGFLYMWFTLADAIDVLPFCDGQVVHSYPQFPLARH